MCELVVGSVVSVVALLWWIVVWLALAEAVLIVESFMIDFFEVIEQMSIYLLFCILGPVPESPCILFPSSYRSPSTFTILKDSLTDVRDFCFSQEKIGAKLGKLSIANQKSQSKYPWHQEGSIIPCCCDFWYACCLSLKLTSMFVFHKVCVFIQF